MPPEYINENIISQKYDVFSLGAVILQIMAGRQSYRDCGRDPSETFIELVRKKIVSCSCILLFSHIYFSSYYFSLHVCSMSTLYLNFSGM